MLLLMAPPGCFSTAATLPSVIESPMAGTTTSPAAAMLVCIHLDADTNSSCCSDRCCCRSCCCKGWGAPPGHLQGAGRSVYNTGRAACQGTHTAAWQLFKSYLDQLDWLR
jgi:hypothetical protein